MGYPLSSARASLNARAQEHINRSFRGRVGKGRRREETVKVFYPLGLLLVL